MTLDPLKIFKTLYFYSQILSFKNFLRIKWKSKPDPL